MGGWKLEVFRMFIYMAFPVGMFHYFNQPENYESWVTEVREKYYPKEDKEGRELFLQSVEEYNRKIEKRKLEAMKHGVEKNAL
ncbi:hypothetical protein KPH14_006132 [Odynerus spinipes]|uniref:Protein PET100 homolog, mitochondrial n=1 Tax=Odynerus spinipes TaxID=1348599 RepID=A0AAD9RIG8_9HYME|nr:hypothetical protein KPH14_006132 [Odynerus spinipes]